MVSLDLVLVLGFVQLELVAEVVGVAEVVVEVAKPDLFLGLWIKSECILCSLVDGLGFHIATQKCLLV